MLLSPEVADEMPERSAAHHSDALLNHWLYGGHPLRLRLVTLGNQPIGSDKHYLAPDGLRLRLQRANPNFFPGDPAGKSPAEKASVVSRDDYAAGATVYRP